jgi:hypothetical protein
MKKAIISTFLIILFSTPFVMGQGSSFGILGGINFQNLNGKDYQGNKLENDLIIGFHAGINLQMPIVPEFYFQPGLIFSTKGASHTGTLSTTTTRLSYIEMPLNLVYKGLLGTGYVMLGFGPYIGYGIKGKVVTEIGSVSNDSDVEFQNVVEIGDPITVHYYRAFDAGGNLFFGYETAGGLFATLNTQLGMLKINPEYKILIDDKSIIKNTGFGLSIGYRF